MAKAKAAAKPSMTVISVAIDSLTLDPDNARKHGQDDVEGICKSLRQFKQQTPIVISSDNVVVKGNGTVMAAMKLGWTNIDAVRTTLTGEQVKAYAIADNRTAELSEWDTAKLLETLQGFSDKSLLDACSFDEVAIDKLLTEVTVVVDPAEPTDPADNPYTAKVEAPIYTPKGEQPAVGVLLDRSKTEELAEEILSAALPDEIEGFLLHAAQRHTVYNFRSIAEFYCHATPAVQQLMERSGLVIIDFDKAIQNGFVKLTEKLGEIADCELGSGENDADE